MTTSFTPERSGSERVVVALTPLQRDALVELVEAAAIRGKDAPLVTGLLRALATARPETTPGEDDIEETERWLTARSRMSRSSLRTSPSTGRRP